MKKTLVVAVAVISQVACVAEVPEAPPSSYGYTTEGLNAVLWVQTAAEYDASARQAYALARLMLPTALADPGWTAVTEQMADMFADLPPAVILDVDETVLDNSPNQARQVLEDRDFATPAWHDWVREERATAVPGALAFTQAAAAMGITVFYVTNRRHEVEPATRRNLAALEFPLDDEIDTILTRDETDTWGSDKGTRRQYVAATHRVLMQIGDNLGDFLSDVDVDPDARRELVARHADYWGERWIVLPNPQYGSWDGALIDFDFGLDRGAKRARKLAALDTGRGGLE
jgi:acid phosphatase